MQLIISFTVDVYGNVTVENVDAIAVSEDGNPLIVMVDDTTKVRISKQDITTGEELPGAKASGYRQEWRRH